MRLIDADFLLKVLENEKDKTAEAASAMEDDQYLFHRGIVLGYTGAINAIYEVLGITNTTPGNGDNA